MHVAPHAHARLASRRLRRGFAAAAPAAPAARAAAHSAAHPRPWNLPARVELGEFCKAGGEWTVEWDRAQRDARAVLEQIDFSRRDIVIWVPGTDNNGMHKVFGAAARAAWSGEADQVSMVPMQYEATWNIRRSFPTGLATMKLVMEGIRQRLTERGELGRKRVLLAGESQGGWIIGETMADPKIRPLVTRAITAGHPWLAKHQYEDGHDPVMRTINHTGDQVAMPVSGDITMGMDAMTAVRTGDIIPNIPKIVLGILQNPVHGVLILHNQLHGSPIGPLLSDPHNYHVEFPRMVEFLRSGQLEVDPRDVERARRDNPA
jgi:hypothetical protein